MTRFLGACACSAVLCGAGLLGQAQSPTLTPGQVLLLANTPGPATAEALKRALASNDPHVRLVAGRVMAVEPDVASVDALVGALAREQDLQTGAELVRDLLLAGGPSAVLVADPQAHRLGPDALLAFAEWEAREQPGQLGSRLSALSAVPGMDEERLAKIVVLAARQHPDERDPLLHEWMAVAPARTWTIALSVLDDSNDASSSEQVLADSLRSDRSSIRVETVWFVLEQLSHDAKPSRKVLDTVAGPVAANSPAWEVFGRELVGRYEHKRTPDRAELIRDDGSHHLDLLDIAVRSGKLTSLEQKAASSVLPFTPSPFPAVPFWAKASARTILPVASGAIGEVFRAAECDANTEKFGVVAATYGPDGRPSHLQVDSAGLPANCLAALTALARTALADIRDVTSPALKQSLVLPISGTFVSCTSTPDLSERVPPSDTDRPKLRSVHKIKDVKPRYPPIAIAQHIAGLIVVDAQMSTTGCVYSVRLLRSIPELDFPAMAAVLQWQFQPAMLNDRPVPFSRTVTVNFLLR